MPNCMLLKNTAMFTEPNSFKGEGTLAMTTFNKIEFSSQFHKLVPVVIERHKKCIERHVPGSRNSLNFLVSCDMTVSQLISIVRRRMKLNLNHAFYLFNEDRTAVRVSQMLGEISSKHKDHKGILHFIFAAQSTFGCPIPRIKSVRSKFPGNEPNPFGAPEPSGGWMEDGFFLMNESDDSEWPPLPADQNNVLLHYVMNQLPELPPQTATFGSGLHSLHSSAQPPPQAGSTAMSNLLQAVGHALPPSVSDSVPMEVSEPATSTTTTTTTTTVQGLPLTQLIQSLNQLVPIFNIHFLLPLTAPTVAHIAGEYAQLINALHRLVQALQNLMQGGQTPTGSVQLPDLPPSFFAPHMLSSLLFPQSNPGSNPSASGSTAATASAEEALNLANQVLEVLQNQPDTPSASTSGTTQFSVLIGYFNQVSQHLEFQNIIATSVIQLHPGPQQAPPLGAPWPSVNSPYLTDSDSLSDEEGEIGEFCDILL